MKSIATLEAEQYLYDSLIIDKMGVCGCHEVVIGRKPLTHGHEIESSTLNWTNSMRIDIVNLRK